ncbi:OsmC family protein [Stappia taiwanensis]|uniref:OsmC family protein n=1 Tax=Stappia taiwanensis TaxID=992267 RepID=A0A838XVF0_9HYPH|nr:bifunctional alpha/beta hydrolase/OsmC family protein [Stappia taiwanensis]MBA4610943.1 OsmC family protein [Stappia taiwanensis]GGE94628.1 osmotically inducible protein C [Stappia taiwanensis]
MSATPIRLTFPGAQGAELAARLDLPTGPVRAYALFAHCFTCSKDLVAARRISEALTREGIGVLRFDFTGLGGSGGDFASTNFSSNVGDLLKAAAFLRDNYEAPRLLIGHSLGGAAMLAVASEIPEAVAVATIGAPADAEHVVHNFRGDLETIRAQGEADVTLDGRSFTIRRQFLDDIAGHSVRGKVENLKKALLVMHAPRDEIVGIDNATALFVAAKHPKSFVSLDTADHLLSNPADAIYAAGVIAAWAARYLASEAPEAEEEAGAGVLVSETGQGKFQAMVRSGAHRMLADEPEAVGGFDSGPSPYDYLSTALGACTVMTLRMYAERKGIAVDRISTRVFHAKVHADDCMECDEDLKGKGGRIDRFDRVLRIEGSLDTGTRQRLQEIADKCPVHRTLEAGALVVTRLEEADPVSATLQKLNPADRQR